MNAPVRNRYVKLRLRILWNILRKRKISLRKIANAIRSLAAHQLKALKSGRLPFVITIELNNECNARCGVCRTPEGRIIDRNPSGDDYFFQTGRMPFEMYTAIIDQVQHDLIMAVLYVNGEPLLYEPLYRAISYASERRVATMISTNGFLLTEDKSRQLLESGLDFIKIAVSGFSRYTARIQHRTGDIERVKTELRTLVRLNREQGQQLIIMMDYISYRYNDHELTEARRFCDELGIIFNVRPGIYMGVDDVEPPPAPATGEPETSLCDWPWKMLTINWNGEIFTCCDLTMWSNAPIYSTFVPENTVLADVWNGSQVTEFRHLMLHGRESVNACARCRRKGTAFTL